jgi:hypothetical protein
MVIKNNGMRDFNERRRKSSGKSGKKGIKMTRLKRTNVQNKDRSVSH